MNLSILLIGLLAVSVGTKNSDKLQTAQEPALSLSYTNFIKDTKWQVDGVPFESAEREEYTFTRFQRSSNEMHWGNFITFEHHTFSSYYSAPCGNDCFTSVSGEYRFVGDRLIELKVLGINYSGFCHKANVNGFHFQEYYHLDLSEDTNTMLVKKKITVAKAASDQK